MKYIYTLMSIVFLSVSANAEEANKMDKFFAALAGVESGGDALAVNKKEKALGIYQIRPAYFLDSNVKGNHKDVFNPKIARKVAEAYFQRYEPKAFVKQDFETLARLHNSGPNWKKKMKATDGYWQKVKKNL